MPKYIFRNDENLLREAVAEARKVGWQRIVRLVLKVLCIIGIALLLALSAKLKGWWLIAFFSWLAFMLFLAPKIDLFFAVRKLKRSVYYGTETHVSVSADGIDAQFAGGASKFNWSSLKKVLRRNNGFLLYFDNEPPRWWPDSALNEGTISEVESLFSSKHTL